MNLNNLNKLTLLNILNNIYRGENFKDSGIYLEARSVKRG